jgi:hypothetical protein
VYVHSSSMHQNFSNYALTNLLFGLCKSIWIIDTLVIRPNPHPGPLTCPLTPKVLWTKECVPIIFSFVIFTLGFTFESFKEFGGVSTGVI